MATYLEQLREKERLEQERKAALTKEQGGTLLQKIQRKEYKAQRQGVEEPELPETYADFAIDQLKAAPRSAVDAVTGLFKALWSPLDTAADLTNIAGSFAQKGTNKYVQAMTGRPTPESHLKNEAEADAVISAVKDKVGTIPRAINTLKEDPFGVMEIFTPARGLLGKGKTGRNPAPDPLGLVGQTVQEGLKATGAPNALYRRGAGIPPSMLDEGVDIAQNAMDAGAGYGTSAAGLRHIERVHDAVGTKMDQIISYADRTGVRIPKAEIQQFLNSYIQDVWDVVDLDQRKKLVKMRDDFETQFEGVDTLLPSRVQAWKQNKYKDAYEAAAAKATPDARSPNVKGMRQHARGGKQALQDRMPELERYNDIYTAGAKIKPFIERRIDSIAQADPTLAKFISKTLNTPKMEGRTAIFLDRIAKGDMGYLEARLNTAEIRALLAIAGETSGLMEMEGLDALP